MQAQEGTTKKRTRAPKTSMKEPSSDLSDLDLSSDYSEVVPKKQSKKRAKLTTSKGKAAKNEEMKEGEKKVYQKG